MKKNKEEKQVMLNKATGWIFMILASSSIGCHHYAIVMRTTFDQEVTEAVVSFDNYQTPKTTLLMGASATIIGVTEPIPKVALVKWRGNDGEYQLVAVNVKEKVPKEFKKDQDGIIFTINDDNSVDVSFEIWVSKFKTKEIKGKNE